MNNVLSINANNIRITNNKVGRVDFSLPNILKWLTKVNPTYELVGWAYLPNNNFWVQILGQKVQQNGHFCYQNRTFQTFLINQFPTF